MKPMIINLYRQIREFHAALVAASDTIMGDAASGDLKEIADTAYAMREIAAFADECRKRANKIGEHSQKIGCFVAVQAASLNDNPADIKITTEYCTATPSVRQILSTPDKRNQPEAYAAMMKHYGIAAELFDATPDEAGNARNPLIAAYWPGIIDRVNADIAAGKPLPPGVDPQKMIAEYRLSIRAHKGVLEGSEPTSK